MEQKTVLSVGQCRPDSAAIAHYLTTYFPVRILTADLAHQVLPLLEKHSVSLVLINRILDADGSEGMDILKQIRLSSVQPDVPVMLVSNYADWQKKAVENGAVHGFGKAELGRPDLQSRLAEFLE
jgi:response regulator RpfG family c-di-GMP phosphodiesterase